MCAVKILRIGARMSIMEQTSSLSAKKSCVISIKADLSCSIMRCRAADMFLSTIQKLSVVANPYFGTSLFAKSTKIGSQSLVVSMCHAIFGCMFAVILIALILAPNDRFQIKFVDEEK